MKVEDELLYECETKRQFVDRATGAKDWRWTVKPVIDVIGNPNAEVRCKDCHGEVRLHGRNVLHGPTPHAEHRYRQDSENCRAGHYFRKVNKPDSQHQESLNPVR